MTTTPPLAADPVTALLEVAGPLCFTSEMHVATEHIEEFTRLLLSTNERARAQAGCRFLFCNQDAADPGTFLMYELWDSADAFVTQEMQQPWMADYLAATEHMHRCERRVRVWQLRDPAPEA